LVAAASGEANVPAALVAAASGASVQVDLAAVISGEVDLAAVSIVVRVQVASAEKARLALAAANSELVQIAAS
jgi:hypothetical protein